ncbi:MAG: chorismate pyruvate-lyase family protein [Methanoregulaceae archaeon]|nr:chorismate pyruvate-lyase family protein [Methanoregulaceae archaeon]
MPVSFQAIEKEQGTLSTLQKILLSTDGSVTSLLEAIEGEEVTITTLSQEVVPADANTASELDIRAGSEVNHRVVELKNSRTGAVLIFAVSDTPLERLEPGFKSDLMRADIPIGRILAKHSIESRREISDMGVRASDRAMSRIFGVPEKDPLLFRKYRIIRQGKPFISIEEVFPGSSFCAGSGVLVSAPSRLHLGLIDLNGALGRIDGGIGIALSLPRTVITAERASDCIIAGGDTQSARRAGDTVHKVLSSLGITGGARITIRAEPPGHVGLGSGTALSLSVACAIGELYGMPVPVRDFAVLIGRGGTSGIGTAAFESGGLIIDGGHSFGPDREKQEYRPSSASGGIRPAQVTTRHDFPEDWEILLVIPEPGTRVSGRDEQDIFRESCPVPIGEVREICHEVVMRLLPGVVEHDLDLFGAAVNRIQEIGFKRIERERQSPGIRSLGSHLRDAGAACAGMSSFGPAVYAITDSGLAGLEAAARNSLGDQKATIIRTRADNTGAMIRHL